MFGACSVFSQQARRLARFGSDGGRARCVVLIRRSPRLVACSSERSSASFDDCPNGVVFPRRRRSAPDGASRVISTPTTASADRNSRRLRFRRRSRRCSSRSGVRCRPSDPGFGPARSIGSPSGSVGPVSRATWGMIYSTPNRADHLPTPTSNLGCVLSPL